MRLGANQWTMGSEQISTWLKTGKVGSKGRYQDGKKAGVWMQWWYDGAGEIQRTKGTYNEGKRSGQWTTWLRDGQIKIKNLQWSQGECVTINCFDRVGASVTCTDECVGAP